MERIGTLVLSVVLVVSVLGASFAGDVPLNERTEEEQEEGIAGDQSSSGEGGVDVNGSRNNFGEPEAEEGSKENSRRIEAEEEETVSQTTSPPPKTAMTEEGGGQETTSPPPKTALTEEGGGQETTSPPPKTAMTEEGGGQETTSARSSDAAAEAGGEAIASPSAKVIIWDESVDLLATVDPNQDQVSSAAAGGGGGGGRERKEPPPSQERHSDVEASKKTGQAGEGEESQIVNDGRSHVNSASSSSLSSSIWKTALFAIFGSPVLLFLMKNCLDLTSKQQSYNRCSNSQCNRSQEMSNREQLTCQFTHHSSAPCRNATSMAIQNS